MLVVVVVPDELEGLLRRLVGKFGVMGRATVVGMIYLDQDVVVIWTDFGHVAHRGATLQHEMLLLPCAILGRVKYLVVTTSPIDARENARALNLAHL